MSALCVTIQLPELTLKVNLIYPLSPPHPVSYALYLDVVLQRTLGSASDSETRV